LLQSFKTGYSSQASLIVDPRANYKQMILYDGGSRFNTDVDTDYEGGYLSAANVQKRAGAGLP
jgi:hypothetical protein